MQHKPERCRSKADPSIPPLLILANIQDFKTEQRKEKDFISKRFGRVESAQTDANETSADLQQFKLRQLEKSKSINDRFDAVELTQGKLSSVGEYWKGASCCVHMKTNQTRDPDLPHPYLRWILSFWFVYR